MLIGKKISKLSLLSPYSSEYNIYMFTILIIYFAQDLSTSFSSHDCYDLFKSIKSKALFKKNNNKHPHHHHNNKNYIFIIREVGTSDMT